MDFGLRISDSGMKGQSAIHNPQSEIVWRVGSWYGLIVAGSIVGLYAADAHVPSYAYQAFSSKAVFKAQNDAGVILVLALGVSLYVNYTYRANNPLYLAGGLLLSTRAAIAGVPLVVLSFYLFVLVKGRGLRRRVYTLGLLGGLVVLSFAAFQFWLQHDVGYTVRRFGLLLEPWAFRRKVPEALDQIAGFSAVEHLFGAGEAGFPLTENDIVDIYGKFGLMTLIPLLAFFGVFYLGLFKRLFVSKTLSAFVLFICFTFYIAHAALAGHALMSAPVNNLFMVLYWLAYRERQGLGVGG